jgi:hypothetical protein
LVVLLLALLWGRFLVQEVIAAAYLVLVVVTVVLVRGVRAEPGSWLSRRAVRRGLVGLMGAVCVALLAMPVPASPSGADAASAWSGPFVLFVLLIVLNIALGRATQRVATAVDDRVDERQETLRNRAHRVAYVILAGCVAVGLVCDIASTASRAWLTGALSAGGLIVLAELLFVLPAMVLAFIEPARIPRDAQDSTTHSTRSRVAAWLLALTLGLPLVMSGAVVFLPEQTSASSGSPSSVDTGGSSTSVPSCREFYGSTTVGVLVTAKVPLHALACWDGHRATESFGMNDSDCVAFNSLLAVGRTTVCQRVTSPDGTLSFTWRTEVTPLLLPFIHRDLTIRVVIDRNGRVEQFP